MMMHDSVFAAKSNATKPEDLAPVLRAEDLSSVSSKDPPIDRLCRLYLVVLDLFVCWVDVA